MFSKNFPRLRINRTTFALISALYIALFLNVAYYRQVLALLPLDSISHLLQLARVGQSFSVGNYQTVRLDRDVVMPLQKALQERVAARGQTLSFHGISQHVAVRGDATLLRVLLRNLVENAHRYSPDTSTITVTIIAGGKRRCRWKMKALALMKAMQKNSVRPLSVWTAVMVAWDWG